MARRQWAFLRHIPRLLSGATLAFCVLLGGPLSAQGGDDTSLRENWQVSPRFEELKPRTIAVLPMDSLSLEPDVETALYAAVYDRLAGKGYSRVADRHVRKIIADFGIETPGQLAGVSRPKLCGALGADALLSGAVEQSAAIHAGVYDAVTVSCSLRLVHCGSGVTLWQAEQWRTAHRQWQIDPLNLAINVLAHEKASREERVTWLVQEMLKTLPDGPISLVNDDLFNRAIEIKGPSKP